MLPIQLEEDRIQEALGLAASGSGSDNDISAVLVDRANRIHLVVIERLVDQGRAERLALVRKVLAGQRPGTRPSLEVTGHFCERTLQEAALPA